jgi:glycerol-3-phosphate acyltransferase PlsY
MTRRKLPGPAVLALSYVVGAIPFSQIVALQTRGLDLRNVGSGTVSGTGLYRVAGLGPLLTGGILDLVKGAVGPVLAGRDRPLLAATAGGAAVAGHNWSVFLGGAGGRGISAAMGSFLVNGWEGSLVLLAGVAGGKLMRATSLGALISYVALLPVMGRRHGAAGGAAAVAVLTPMLVKRVMGNRPATGSERQRVWLNRLLFDQDTPAWPFGSHA